MKRYALSIIGGVFYFLGFNGFGVWPLTFVCLVPLLFALDIVQTRHWRSAAAVGLVFGFVTNAGGYHWMQPMLETFSGYGFWPSLGFASVFWLYLALQFALFALAYRWLRNRGWSAAWVAPALLIAAEWCYPLLFPTFIANGLFERPLMIQIADLGGPSLVSFVVIWINVAIYELLRWLAGSRAYFPKRMSFRRSCSSRSRSRTARCASTKFGR